MIKKANGEKIVTKTEVADTYLKKTIGLMFKKNIPRDYALIIPLKKTKKVTIHSFFVFHDLDIITVSEKNKILEKTTLKALRDYTKIKAKKVIEARKNELNKIKPGNKIKIT
ncbi:MAG: hypothetical protein BTN85_0229 [Candidatus Methanohalarchaeum thermophilum]|uniref:Uncharacterized protein n=1 Tax=Methanohalarchaeum thermophilum TaxID=1903181 RepID=A0A1Q6DTQ5_METT1|nr:MAG: hypothetical protein BTN85_0229 [Candidatus Methanohalarchaeum thermophilum]